MDIHYNAFISYRHHPEDIRVATEVQRALERYRIPKAVRRDQKGNLRLFRDKDELPITSNLTDEITRALRNSDYLIVICSTHTKESVWVQREIETFLQTHAYDKVLTVLVDGEPYDTIPEILQYRQEADPDTGEMERVVIEPLSCDWRVSKKKAYREELPRLAAALLHCGYDELRQRQRQYKMRRMITFFSLALAASVGLMAYFLYTSIKIQQANDRLQEANQEIREANVKIKENLDEALRNQSEYLASAAGELYDNGDRLTAIVLAVAALPSEEDPRPYVADAEKQLSRVLGLYSSGRGNMASGAFDPRVTVSEFAVSDDGKVIYLLDENNQVTAWDAGNYTQLGRFDLLANYVNSMVVAEHNLLVSMSVDYGSGNPELCCYNCSGELLWSMETCKDFARLDGDTLMVLQMPYGEPAVIEFLDLTTGKRKREALALGENTDISPYGFCGDSYVSTLPVILQDSSWENGVSSEYIVKAELSSGQVSCLRPDLLWDMELRNDLNLIGAAVTQQGNILVMVGDGSGMFNGRFGSVTTTSPANATLLCYDGKTETLKWNIQTTAYSYCNRFTLTSITGTGNIFCQKGNSFFIIEEATGQILARNECVGNILSIYTRDGYACGIMDNGQYFEYDFEDNTCRSLPLMSGNLIQGEIAEGYFLLENLSSRVTRYMPSRQTGWTAFEGDAAKISVYKKYRGENMLTVYTNGGQFMVLDLVDHCVRACAAVEGRYSLTLLGFSEDQSEFYCIRGEELLVLDVNTGEIRSDKLETGLDGYGEVKGINHLAEDTLFYLVRQEDTLHLAQLNLQTQQLQLTPFVQHSDAEWNYGSTSGTIAANAGYAWLWHENAIYEFDRACNIFRVLMDGISEYPQCKYHEKQNVFSVCTESSTVFFEPGKGKLLEISQAEHRDVSVQLYEDQILSINDAAKLIRYDWQGTRLSETELNAYSTFYMNINVQEGENVDIHWSFSEDGELILGLFNMGNIVDCSQWRTRAYIENYVAYDPVGDVLISTADSIFGFYPRYTTEQVIAVAKEQLGTYELPEGDKIFYGID